MFICAEMHFSFFEVYLIVIGGQVSNCVARRRNSHVARRKSSCRVTCPPTHGYTCFRVRGRILFWHLATNQMLGSTVTIIPGY